MTSESVAAKGYEIPAWPNSTTSATSAHAAKVAALFREHNSALVGFLRARLRSEQDAREAAQEAYVKLLQLDNLGAVSFLRSYLFRVAANVATDRLRQRQVRLAHASVESLGDICEEHAAPERGVAATQELSFIRGCLFELPERWRDAFIRHRIRGESEVSIARTLGLSERMVRNYLVQTLVYCRSRLDGCTVEQARARLKK
jgi:RNA polymerase sigma-70 factor (ECF subfamily)